MGMRTGLHQYLLQECPSMKGWHAMFLADLLEHTAPDRPWAYPSLRTLARGFGCTVEWARRLVRQMEALDYFKIEARQRDDGGRTSNLYRFSDKVLEVYRAWREKSFGASAKAKHAVLRHLRRAPVGNQPPLSTTSRLPVNTESTEQESPNSYRRNWRKAGWGSVGERLGFKAPAPVVRQSWDQRAAEHVRLTRPAHIAEPILAGWFAGAREAIDALSRIYKEECRRPA